MTTEKMNVSKSACLFNAGVKSNVSGKQIELIASSGKPFKHWHWQQLALDLTGMKLIKSRLPLLMEHDKNRPVGFFNDSDIQRNGQLLISGTLIDSEPAKELLNLTSQGYPLECSVYAVPERIERVPDGEEVEVNGHIFKGGGHIFRSWTLREASIATFGFDSATSASVRFSSDDKLPGIEVVNREDVEDERLANEIHAASASGGDSGVVDADEHMAAQELVDSSQCDSMEAAHAYLAESEKIANEILTGKPSEEFYKHQETIVEDEPGEDEYHQRVQKLAAEQKISIEEASKIIDEEYATSIFESSGVPISHQA